ncbi:MAG: histidine kinase [Cytophagales bacterium]|nr:histidine kinase [Cytophagales bacterium]
MMKQPANKHLIVVCISVAMMSLVGGARIGIMQRMDGWWMDFSFSTYVLRMVFPFILTYVFLWLNLLNGFLKIGQWTINLESTGVRIVLNLFAFLVLHMLMDSLLHAFEADLPIGPRSLIRSIIGNAMLVAGILVISWIYRLIDRNHQISLANSQLKAENEKSKYEALKAQINPHFFFNSLYAVTGLIDKNPEEAKSFIREMSDVFRYALENGKEDLVLLASELNFAHVYIKLFKTRFPDSITFEVSVADIAKRQNLPSFSIQLLLENAVKHNQFDQSNPLHIKIFDQDGFLVIENSLRPRPVEKSSEIGLFNLNQRYIHLSKQEIVIRKLENSFIVNLPLIDHERNDH